MKKVNYFISLAGLIVSVLLLINFGINDDGEMGSSAALVFYLFIIAYFSFFFWVYRTKNIVRNWIHVLLTIIMVAPWVLLATIIYLYA